MLRILKVKSLLVLIILLFHVVHDNTVTGQINNT